MTKKIKCLDLEAKDLLEFMEVFAISIKNINLIGFSSVKLTMDLTMNKQIDLVMRAMVSSCKEK